jgi:hypothetical protein
VFTKHGLKILNVNSVLWYHSDKLVEKDSDPGDQLDWLIDELRMAETDGRKALLASIPVF